jgi:peptidoglycan/xylan/chitin deacetylase (PgdA/CDA1 family)
MLQVALHHHVDERPSGLVDDLGVRTPPALFESHVRRLARDYEIVDLDQVLSGRLPRRALLLTFDDGFRSVADVAVPILERLGLPSVFFVSAAYLEPGSLPLDALLCHLRATVGHDRLATAVTGAPDGARTLPELFAFIAEAPYERRIGLGDELAERFEVDRGRVRDESGLFLDASELAGLAGRGCEIGNHTRSHLACRAIADEPAADEQIVSHKALLEDWAGTPVRSFSYPYGCRADATPLMERVLRESGHEASFLVEARPNRRRRAGQAWNRVSLDAQPVWRLPAELELKPRLRSVRDRLQPAIARG